jgi:hypothetical protein
MRHLTTLDAEKSDAINIATVIGAFAALCKASGAAFRFPGTQKIYDGVFAQMTDAHVLARASLWAATAETASNEAFNYVHEPFRWRRIWERSLLPSALTQLSHHIGFGSLRVAEFRHSVSSPLICGAKLI